MPTCRIGHMRVCVASAAFRFTAQFEEVLGSSLVRASATRLALCCGKSISECITGKHLLRSPSSASHLGRASSPQTQLTAWNLAPQRETEERQRGTDQRQRDRKRQTDRQTDRRRRRGRGGREREEGEMRSDTERRRNTESHRHGEKERELLSTLGQLHPLDRRTMPEQVFAVHTQEKRRWSRNNLSLRMRMAAAAVLMVRTHEELCLCLMSTPHEAARMKTLGRCSIYGERPIYRAGIWLVLSQP